MTNKKQKEQDLAKYFEERRGDVSQWEQQPVKTRRRRGSPTTVFSIRFTQEELQTLQRRANDLRITISELVRGAALRTADGESALGDSAQAAAFLRRIADYVASQGDRGRPGGPDAETSPPRETSIGPAG